MNALRDDICWVCGGDGADTLCSHCGNLVCSDCFDKESQRCLECVEEMESSKIRKKKIQLIGGMILMIIGLSTAAAGLVTALPSDGITVVFPFIFGNVTPWVAGAYSFLFFLTVAIASLIPWYIHTKTKTTIFESSDVAVMEGKALGGENFDHIEYLITTEIPKRLEKTIMIEANGTNILLRSTMDKEFVRNYPIPLNHDLEDLDYDYDEGYVIIRLHLVRIP